MTKKILVVEDESEVRDLIKCVLENDGYETVTAHDGLEGLKKAHVEMPDLIISDLVMDKMPGGVMCERLKEDKKTCNIPVLYLTSVISIEEAKQIQQRLAGKPTLAKPFEDSELLAKVKELL